MTKKPVDVNLLAITLPAGRIDALTLGRGRTDQSAAELILRWPGRGVRDGGNQR